MKLPFAVDTRPADKESARRSFFFFKFLISYISISKISWLRGASDVHFFRPGEGGGRQK